MNTDLGEVNTTDNLPGKTLSAFTLLDGLHDDATLFGQVALAASQAARCCEGFSFYVSVSYLADVRELQVRLRTDNGCGEPEYRLNPQTNRPWYRVVWEDGTPIHISEMWRCNGKGAFSLVLRGGALVLYSGDETDLLIRPALGQNEVFLLKAFPGNLYQFPTTGVGLIEFLHGNFENSGLAARLQQEFQRDKMVIHNAYMDSQTGELHLEVTEKDG